MDYGCATKGTYLLVVCTEKNLFYFALGLLPACSRLISGSVLGDYLWLYSGITFGSVQRTDVKPGMEVVWHQARLYFCTISPAITFNIFMEIFIEIY